jgi:hypothetical protein
LQVARVLILFVHGVGDHLVRGGNCPSHRVGGALVRPGIVLGGAGVQLMLVRVGGRGVGQGDAVVDQVGLLILVDNLCPQGLLVPVVVRGDAGLDWAPTHPQVGHAPATRVEGAAVLPLRLLELRALPLMAGIILGSHGLVGLLGSVFVLVHSLDVLKLAPCSLTTTQVLIIRGGGTRGPLVNQLEVECA